MQEQAQVAAPEEELDFEELQQAVADGIEEAEVELFGEAETLAARGARLWRRMAKLAYKHRSNKRALQIFSFEWGYSAGNMARAVVRHPEWFGNDVQPTSQQLRILFILSQLEAADEAKFYKKWRNNQALQPFEMQRIISLWKKKQKNAHPKQQKIKMQARAIHINRQAKLASLELASENDAMEDVVEGAVYAVQLSPTDQPDAPS